MDGDKSQLHLRKRKFDEMGNREILNSSANKVCNTIFYVGELVNRTKLYKTRARKYRKMMVEMMAANNNYEAFAYGTYVLMHKKKIAETLDLASRLIAFTNYFQYRIDEMDAKLFNTYDKISYLVSSGFNLDLRRELRKAEEVYEIPKKPNQKTAEVKVTKKSVRAYMRRVKNNPKLISMATMDTSKAKSIFDVRRI